MHFRHINAVAIRIAYLGADERSDNFFRTESIKNSDNTFSNVVPRTMESSMTTNVSMFLESFHRLCRIHAVQDRHGPYLL